MWVAGRMIAPSFAVSFPSLLHGHIKIIIVCTGQMRKVDGKLHLRSMVSGNFNIYCQFKIRENIYNSIAAESYCPFDHPLKVINSLGRQLRKVKIVFWLGNEINILRSK